MNRINANTATLAGTVASVPKKYECNGEAFYKFELSIERKSGTSDIIPI